MGSKSSRHWCFDCAGWLDCYDFTFGVAQAPLKACL